MGVSKGGVGCLESKESSKKGKRKGIRRGGMRLTKIDKKKENLRNLRRDGLYDVWVGGGEGGGDW